MDAILIHGTCDRNEYFDEAFPSLSNSHWFPWLQKQLLIKGIFTQTPEMELAYAPQYDLWKREVERYSISSNTILIGHSCGGGFLLRWLSENPVAIKKLILVAPWLDPHRQKTSDFFDFQIDTRLIDRVGAIYIFVSTDDESDVLDSVKLVEKSLPNAIFHVFQNKGHFTFNDLQGVEFPELLEAISGKI